MWTLLLWTQQRPKKGSISTSGWWSEVVRKERRLFVLDGHLDFGVNVTLRILDVCIAVAPPLISSYRGAKSRDNHEAAVAQVNGS